MGDALNSMGPAQASSRVRVRTPGKHIVLFSLAVTFMISISTLVLSKAGLALPEQPFAAQPAATEETFITDLAPDDQGRLRLLKLNVAIETADAAAQDALDSKRALVRERLSFFLRELTPADLDGTLARERLKTELKRRVDLSIAPAEASAVTIQSIIIQ
jgi:flagellar basal body-associated protein FliL